MKPDIGLHPDVPAEVYHGWDAASSHRLRTLARSPAHLRYELDNPEEPTPALVFGEALHTACLEPTTFHERFAVLPKCDRRTREGKALYEEFLESKGKRKTFPYEDLDRCMNILRAVRGHETAGELLQGLGPVEVSGVWRDGATGQLCKLRADKLAESVSTIADLKTCEDASPEAFERSILRYGYHRQAAMYLRGLAALGRPFDHFAFICVEVSPPHAVAVYRLDDEAIEAGDAELAELLERYAECERTGNWPSYPPEVQTISLPAWHLKQLSYGRIG